MSKEKTKTKLAANKRKKNFTSTVRIAMHEFGKKFRDHRRIKSSINRILAKKRKKLKGNGCAQTKIMLKIIQAGASDAEKNPEISCTSMFHDRTFATVMKLHINGICFRCDDFCGSTHTQKNAPQSEIKQESASRICNGFFLVGLVGLFVFSGHFYVT